jgi:hypothetical protein
MDMNNLGRSAELFEMSTLFFEGELMGILNECVNIHQLFINNEKLFPNDEEAIRDGFMIYLKNDNYKRTHFPLGYYQFDKEVEDNKGRLDIRILPINPYKGDKAYYSIECKRIDNKNMMGKTGLNAKYVKNGICRYVGEYYTNYFNANVMFGFVVSPMDISQNVDNINLLMSYDYIDRQGNFINANVTQKMTYKELENSYPHSYVSMHTSKSGKELTLYHLMFDFSHNIKYETDI